MDVEPSVQADLVMSQATMFVVPDPAATYRRLASWLKPGGVMSHTLNFSSHGMTPDWNGHWTITPPIWRAKQGRHSYYYTQVSHSEHIRFIEESGCSIVLDRPEIADSCGLTRQDLARPFRHFTDADLSIKRAVVIARKKPDDGGLLIPVDRLSRDQMLSDGSRAPIDSWSDSLVRNNGVGIARGASHHGLRGIAPVRVGVGRQDQRTAGIKQLLYRTAAGAGGDVIGRMFNRHKSLIVTYHGLYEGEIDPLLNLDGLYTGVNEFRRQVEYLARRYALVPLSEIREARDGRPRVAITFDDGYASVGYHARPLLKAMGLPSTVFVTTHFVFARGEMWWDSVRHLVRQCNRPTLAVTLGGRSVTLRVRTTEDKAAAIRAIQEQLKRAPREAREAALKDLRESADGANPRSVALFEPLRAEDLRGLERDGMSVESHTVSHESLVSLSAKHLDRELTESKETLEQWLRKRVQWIAYPFGHFDNRVVSAVQRAGYLGALTGRPGLNASGADLFRLRRLSVGGDTSFDQFRVLSSGIRDVVSRAGR
jgi:peptidoglycan/xylan/chitin deacetylase (PgdA/CDA1 family)